MSSMWWCAVSIFGGWMATKTNAPTGSRVPYWGWVPNMLALGLMAALLWRSAA